ncbi:Nuclear pore complex protein-related isoform 1 [Hibiscus syriacus]|uniref:Nuclear pore complex protein-related isoform 1 n=1 Tax=Hibiscus syriacus TaxID=106335 RepID=A0A6A3B517_HIBSY|nr:uncharacterized protein LOC120115380 [Hibiscus syriacus]KAE8712040.1 Nuclear pore complex protein-related isoform 1 [Hibiscus syriacus]
MGFSKEEKSRRILRVFKTAFFLITMVISFLVFSAPVFFVIADTILPSALLSASLSPSSSSLFETLSSRFNNYDFRSSLIDIPLISIVRSAVIICVYSFCDGPRLSRGPYLGITIICSVSSLILVSLKVSFMFRSFTATETTLFTCSFAFAIAHIVVAYRTSCRERRKLLVYKIDIEAIAACKNGFPRYQKIPQEERVKI